jgi:predicted small secreted protein
MNNQRKYFAALVVGGLLATSMTGCNTVRGIGKDPERAGEVIQKESDRAQDRNNDSPAPAPTA